MPRLTKEERAELEARLADDDADDDESDEVTVSRPDGSSFTGTFRRALQLGLVSLPKPDDDKGKGKPRVSVLTPRTRNTGS
jgi:hypothetical protein